jgi:hypothetical protein
MLQDLEGGFPPRIGFSAPQDNSKVGIRATLTRLSGLLQDTDPELWYHLVHKNKARRREAKSTLCVVVKLMG